MRVIAELRPEFIKVDRSLIQAVDTDRARRALVVSLLSFSGHIGARVIAEGIETVREEEVLQSLGVQFGQGWLLGRPVLAQPVDGQQGSEVVDPTLVRAAARCHRSASAPPGAADAPRAVRHRSQSCTRRHRASSAASPRALSDAALALQSEHDPMRILGVMADQMSRVVQVTEMAIFVADYETYPARPGPRHGARRGRDPRRQHFARRRDHRLGIRERDAAEHSDDTSKHPLARQIPGTA